MQPTTGPVYTQYIMQTETEKLSVSVYMSLCSDL